MIEIKVADDIYHYEHHLTFTKIYDEEYDHVVTVPGKLGKKPVKSVIMAYRSAYRKGKEVGAYMKQVEIARALGVDLKDETY